MAAEKTPRRLGRGLEALLGTGGGLASERRWRLEVDPDRSGWTKSLSAADRIQSGRASGTRGKPSRPADSFNR